MVAGSLCFADASASAQSPQEQLADILKAHPELVLDVLKAHSEEVLDIVQQGSDSRRRATLLRQWENDRQQHKNVTLEGRPFSGPAGAPVTIVAFSDFLCTYCHQAAFTLGNLMTKYKGNIRLVFKLTPKSDTGRLVGSWFLAAYKLDKAKAWKMYALLFDRQQKVEADPLPVIRSIAAEAGLDVKTLEAEVNGNAKSFDDIMTADTAEARSLGFVGTPYFLVNDMVIRGALPLENFVEATELALKQPLQK